jgi:hypothetical protein
MEPGCRKRRPVWTATSQTTGPKWVCRGLVDFSTIFTGSTGRKLFVCCSCGGFRVYSSLGRRAEVSSLEAENGKEHLAHEKGCSPRFSPNPSPIASRHTSWREESTREHGETMVRTLIFLLWNSLLLYMALVVNIWFGFMLLAVSTLAVLAIVYGERKDLSTNTDLPLIRRREGLCNGESTVSEPQTPIQST